ncbi:MAG TPA: SdrD B-like domain-containing protein [Thermoanaerobaculia bacterium]|nr:SdrD B-like domain-containing protein [Thermoanaerobaculia bacterium]
MSFSRIVSTAGGAAAGVLAASFAIAAPGRSPVRTPSSAALPEIRRTSVATATAPAAPAGFSAGAVAVVDAAGTTPAGNVFSSRDQVHLAAGPADPACAIGALADGAWFYQVTDASGQTLLSGAPRSLQVSGGVIVSADGASSGETACGSEIVALAPFDRAPNGTGNYRVWLTPAADLQTASSCGSGCFFGFLPGFSTTATFAVREDSRCRTTHCLSGVVFSDVNQNGVRDSGEPGIPGVVVSATDGHGISATGISGPDGAWSICGLPETQYTVTETVPAGYRQTAPSATVQISRYLASVVSDSGGTFTVTFCNESFSNLTFGNAALPGSISGTKFNDANGNGLLDSGEAGVAGVTINLFVSADAASHSPIATTVTDANGGFTFAGVAAGSYFLREDLPNGYRQTTPAGDGDLFVSVAPGQSVTDVLFGNQLATGAITGTKFDDANGNGVRDPGEGGLAGVTIQISGPSGTSSTTTDSGGNFSFTGLAPGTYILSEVVPDGYHQTFPAPPGTMSVTLSAGQTATVLFGNQALAATGSISGLKFNDANGNGLQDAGESGVAGVTINLFAASGGALVATTTTGADGTFTFTGINPGSYQVSEVVPDGTVQTLPGGSGMVPVTVAAGQTASGVLFGNRSSAGGTISGFVFYDINKNQIQDIGEKPFPNVTVIVKDTSGNVVATAVTDSNGDFTLTGIAPGDYTVWTLPPVNFFQTVPPKKGPIPVHLEPGGTVTGLVFGLAC